MAEGKMDERVLVVAPQGHDAAAMVDMLAKQGISAVACSGPIECLRELQIGAGALLLTEEALELPGASDLMHNLKVQPAWSELPLVVLSSGGEARQASLLDLRPRPAV